MDVSKRKQRHRTLTCVAQIWSPSIFSLHIYMFREQIPSCSRLSVSFSLIVLVSCTLRNENECAEARREFFTLPFDWISLVSTGDKSQCACRAVLVGFTKKRCLIFSSWSLRRPIRRTRADASCSMASSRWVIPMCVLTALWLLFFRAAILYVFDCCQSPPRTVHKFRHTWAGVCVVVCVAGPGVHVRKFSSVTRSPTGQNGPWRNPKYTENTWTA